MVRSGFAATVALLGAVVACGEATEDGVAVVPDEVTQLSIALCEARAVCGCTGAEGCADEQEALWAGRAETAKSLDLAYDPECANALRSGVLTRACGVSEQYVHPCAEHCTPWHGSRGTGEACTGDLLASECEKRLVCLDGRCDEPCAVLSGLQPGEPCGQTAESCAIGSTCDFGSASAETAVCRAGGNEGESCDWGCAVGLACDYNRYVCARLQAEGEGCGVVECAPGMICSADAGYRCEPFARIGEACGYDSGQCAPMTFCVDGRCVPPAAEGERCTLNGVFGGGLEGDIGCGGGLVCEKGQCEHLTAGDDCSGSFVCSAGAFCDDGVCSDRLGNGDPCNDATTCVSGYCPHGACAAPPAERESCEDTGRCAAGLACSASKCVPALSVGPSVCTYRGW